MLTGSGSQSLSPPLMAWQSLMHRSSSGSGLPHCQRFPVTLRHITLDRKPLDDGSNRCRPLPDNKHQSQETDAHAPGGIRARSPSKRAAADPRHSWRGNWDRLTEPLQQIILISWNWMSTKNNKPTTNLHLLERKAIFMPKDEQLRVVFKVICKYVSLFAPSPYFGRAPSGQASVGNKYYFCCCSKPFLRLGLVYS